MTIDLDAARRVEQSLIVGGLIKPDASIRGCTTPRSPGAERCPCRDLTISYGGEPVLERASLSVARGQFVSLSARRARASRACCGR